MPGNNITLIYNKKKRIIKIPNNYSELENIFIEEFKENKDESFSFSYITYINKEFDFTQIINLIKEKIIYVSSNNNYINNVKEKKLEKEIYEINNINKKMENDFKSLKIFDKEKGELNDKIKNKIDNIKLENKNLNEMNKNILQNKSKLEFNNKKTKKEDFFKTNNLNPKNIIFLTNIAVDSFADIELDNTFSVFKSMNNILYLIYADEYNSIIFYNIIDNKKINEIKNAHNRYITNFRYFLDTINKRDLIISLSSIDNNLKLWDINNFDCLLNLQNINKNGNLYSVCFLKNNNKNYIITSCSKYSDISEYIKVFDFNGKKIKEINNSDDAVYFIDTFYDKKLFKNYLLTGNVGYIKSYEFNKNKLYCKYNDNDCAFHNSIIINDKEDVIKLIESSEDGNIRIWDFYSGELLNKIKVCNNALYGICLWNKKYIFVGCEDKSIKLINIKNGNIKNLIGHTNDVLTVKNIFLPKYGECLISQSYNNGEIKLWLIKN